MYQKDIKKKNIIFINKEIKNLNTKIIILILLIPWEFCHISYPKQLFKIINKKLKKLTLLVYLYHDFEENSFMYKLIWKLSEILRNLYLREISIQSH